jgi:hypothetical protein
MLLRDCWRSWNCGFISSFVRVKIKHPCEQRNILALKNDVITFLLKHKALCIETCVLFRAQNVFCENN